MNKPSFTPGRWRYGRTLSHGLAVFSTPQVGSPEHIVAIADENEANAQLIAASPSLYEFVRCKAEEGDIDAQKIITSVW